MTAVLELTSELRSLVDLLRWRADERPAATACVFLGDGEVESERLTYADLDRRARLIAAELQAFGMAGERALLLYPPGLEFVAAFFGCAYAGTVAVPAYPPRSSRLEPRLRAIIADMRPAVVLTIEALRGRIGASAAELGLGRARLVATDRLPEEQADAWVAPDLERETLAFLQYTSGSTASPKGVMVSHGNILHNEEVIRRACHHTSDSTFVSWLPMYHDMGLIGGVLQPLYIGALCVLMSPVAFLQKPVRWLRAISTYRGHTSGGPNFAYELCCQKINPEERAALDLDSWRVAFNGAEPVLAATVERFALGFAACGFRPAAFFPCYGLAEATLIVSGGGGSRPTLAPFAVAGLKAGIARPAADGAAERSLVGCGPPAVDHEIVIVDPQRRTVHADGEIGEIWVAGPSVARGYWNRPEATAETFQAAIAGTDQPRFLQTGDLGFLRGGELFVTGRIKDLIILRGRNHYPQDIELTAELRHPGLRAGGSAAFSLAAEGEEGLVVVLEADFRQKPDWQEVLASVRQAIYEDHEIQAEALVVVKAGSALKTSSGKIQRAATRQKFLEGGLDVLAQWRRSDRSEELPGEPSAMAGATPEAWLRERVAAALSIDPSAIDPWQPLSRQGLDSVAAIELAYALEERLGVVVSMASLLEGTTLAELGSRLREPPAGEAVAPGEGEMLAGAAGLSYGQEALWFLQRLVPSSPGYHIASALRIRSDVDPRALRRAVELWVERHSALRTTFVLAGGAPSPRVHATLAPDVRVEDAAAWSEADLQRRLVAETLAPFDLETGSPVRCRLFLRRPGEHVLLLVFHHIAADFWSLSLLLAELRILYPPLRAGAEPVLPAPAMSYEQYAGWQREQLAGPLGERRWSYWRERLASLPPRLDLPTDRPRPAVPAALGGAVAFRLDPAVTGRLRELARAHGTTLYTVLLAGFQALLHHYTGQTDLVLGSPSAGRSRGRLAGLVGYLVNLLAMRADLAGDPGAGELVERARAAALADFEHQDFPFPLLVERLRPGGEPEAPLFPVVFALQKIPLLTDAGLAAFALGEAGARLELGGLELESIALPVRPAPFDLTLMLAEAGEELAASLQYRSELFDPATALRMAGHYRELLGELTGGAPHLSEMRLFTAAERHCLLAEWSATGGEAATGLLVHEGVAEQARLRGEAPAAIFAGRALTYGELEVRAGRLARRLRALGVGPDVPVGVCTDRSPAMLIALLATLKAGGAYVPLDPAHPADRLGWMLENAGAKILLTESAVTQRIPAVPGVQVVNLDDLAAEEPGREAGTANIADIADFAAVAESRAYIIYTSGSTGRPKGVQISHGSLLNLVSWHRQRYAVTASDRATQLAGVGFDASVWEIWPYLTAGASLWFPDEETRLSPPRLADWLAANGITLCFVPTPLAEAMLGLPAWAGGSLRALLTGGDRLHAGPPPGAPFALINHYGPTENTVVTTAGTVAAGEAGVPSIGRPIAGVLARVLDPALRPVVIGGRGELLVGGPGLARGYLGDPAATAERLIPDPFAGKPGDRLYRTGDLVRFRADGRLDFLGRADRQVKLRGQRIELGEIESTLLAHPAVGEAAVVARRGGDETALAAYWVFAGGSASPISPALPAELRAWLRDRLPGAMVPAAFVRLDRFPLTPNGKLDLAALPAPPDEGPAAAAGGELSPLAELLAGMWASLLGRESIGVQQNVFELGAHSLLAAQAAARIRELAGLDLPLRRLFDLPTVAKQAEELEGLRRGAHLPARAPLSRAPRRGDLPASFAQQRLWFLDQLEPASGLYNIPVALRFSGPFDAAALWSALRAVAARHESLRTTFEARGGEPVQVISPVPRTGKAVVDLAGLAAAARGREAARLAVEEAVRPFDLQRGPLVRGAVVHLSAEDHLLLLTLHHIVADGWSMGVLLGELAALYASAASGEPGRLPELPVQYADFAGWQRDWLRGDVLAAQLAFWRRELAGVPVLDLPADRRRPLVPDWRGASQPVVLPDGLSGRLAALGRRDGATLFMTLLAAFEVWLHRYTGQERWAIGTPVASRDRIETEGLIGLFVNTLALRVDLTAQPDFRRVLRRVREICLDAFAHQDLPFERLVEELQPERSLSVSPVFQVMLSLQPAAPELSFAGLRPERFETGLHASKFDLSLSLTPGDAGVTGAITYRRDLFDPTTIARMADGLVALLDALAVAPELPVASLAMLPTALRHQLLAEWNDVAGGGDGQPVHEQFAAAAARHPEAPALVCDDLVWTYSELDARANRLARLLRRHGVGPEETVGVCLGRSAAAILAILAIHKAGGAYVPLDTAYPAERLAFMLADAAPRVVLTTASLAPALPEMPARPARVLLLDAEEERIAAESAEALAPLAAGEHLAYLIYTSGSTGRAKGVAVEHRQLAAYVRGVCERLDLPPRASYATVSTIAADLGHTMIFPALARGGCLHVVSHERLGDAAAMAEYFSRHAIDCLKIVPSHLAALLGTDGPARVLPGRRLVLGGEACDWDLAERLLAAAGDCRIFNHYGPTETTVGVAAHPLAGQRSAPGALRPPLGRPLPGNRIHLLDGGMQPVFPGVPGELYVGGPQVSRGYFRRPGATAERFLPDPFGPAGARLYRTGDLARTLPDGTLEFLGRIDHQVKIRGFRVELREIESALAAHPGVREAVVTLRDEPGEDRGERRLVAYVVPAEPAPTAAELRILLARSLPEPMLPAAWVFLAALPLTPNGKVDRRALPAPAAGPAEAAGQTAPRTPLEEVLAAAWAATLGRQSVGVHDDFFDLGGHSLLATRLVSRVRDLLRVELPVRALFEAPTVAGMAARLEAAGAWTAHALPPVRPVPREGDPPLSFAQERLWFLDRLAPGDSTYNLPYRARLTGSLQAAALARSLSEIVRRHEALRTTFPCVDGRPVQRIAAGVPLPLPVIDLAGLPGTRREAEAFALSDRAGRRPFDLERGPLMRAALVRLDRDAHLLLLDLHHIVSDAWSRGLLVGELWERYGSPEAPSPELQVQYADYAAWQRQWLQGGELARLVSYWRQRLAGASSLELPADRPLRAARAGGGAVSPVRIGRELAERLRGVGRQRGATPFMVLLAGLQALLSCYTGQEDVSVGTPIAGRTRAELEGLIGFFVNTLVLRTDLSGAPSLLVLVERAREVALGAYAHQELPFEKLVEALRVERDLSRTPLFQVMLILQNAPMPELSSAELRLSPQPVHTATAKFDLTLALTETEEGLEGWLEYSTERFEAATVERLGWHLSRLLEAASAEPEREIGDLPLLSDGERAQLLGELSGWEEPSPGEPEVCLHELFEAQARRTPEAVALVYGAERLSYAELARRAEAVAARLVSLGVGPETGVGVCAPRGTALVAGLLGVLKAGGMYLPLDPAYPAERLRLMLEDTGASLVLTQGEAQERLPASGARRVLLEEILEESGAEPAPTAGRRAVWPGQLAYVIYTSGSTGRPKGVAIEHRAAVRMVRWAGEAFARTELSGVLASTSICFDLSVFELFAPLAYGGRVILAANALELAELPAAGEVTLINTVPSAMAELVRLGAVPGSVRAVSLAGEALPGRLSRQLYDLGVQRVVNLYGPSEDTTYSTVSWVAPEERQPAIGRPLGGSRAYVVDAGGRLAPAGVAGELYLGGGKLARGYLGRPELTAQRFVPDPYGRLSGGRLYRTGDRVRFRGDGELEFLGRLDGQVKVRGFRIELGEIEAVLGEHERVREAVVTVREDEPGDRRLVGYLVAEGEAPGVEELRTHLRRRLPEPMVPTAWVVLAALPRTPNGKVDRKALPAPAGTRAGSQADYLAPRTPTEQRLAELWAGLLRIERVGVHDNFFDLGGHSLLATQAVSQIRQSFGVELPLRQLFEHPTLAELAAQVQAAQGGEGEEPIPRVPRSGRLPLSFAQQRLWFLDQLAPGGAAYNLSLGLRLHGPLDALALRRSLSQLVARHEVLRSRFETVEGRPWQLVEPVVTLAMPTVDLAALPAAAGATEGGELTRRQATLAFDLGQAPLLRAALVRTAPDDHLLLLTLHHIVSDAWSWGLLVGEMWERYGSPESPLPELPVQYADYAAWQRQRLEGEELARLVSYWRERLAGAPLLELPADRPRRPGRAGGGAVWPVRLERDLAERLRALGRQCGATPFMVLLAGLQALLSRYTGQEDVSVGSPIAGRTRAELEGLIGFFVNTLVLRTDLSGGPGLAALAGRAREVALGAYAHQELPFEKLVEALRVERDLSRTPLFQVMLILQNAPLPELRSGPLRLSPQPVHTGTAKFDLTLALTETGEGLEGWLEYSTERFEAVTVERLGSHLLCLLEGGAAEPEWELRDLPLLADRERLQLLGEWSGEAGPAAEPEACLHELFEAQARRTPEAVALVCGAERLSYAELARQAEAVAARLMSLGVGPETAVGVCAPRGTALVAGLLGVLKAGGMYLPLDPAYPAERLRLMLEDTGASLVLTQGEAQERLPASGARRVLLEEILEESGAEPAPTAGRRAVWPGQLAYVIYTSGSTGRPKGVAIEHRAAVRMVRWAGEAFARTELSGVLASTSICFDLSVFELFAPLAYGGRVILAANALELAELPAAGEVTLINTVPSAMAELVRLGAVPGSVRAVSLAGEALPGRLSRQLYDLGVQRVVNLYGPSEDTTYSTVSWVAPEERQPAIGRPLGGSRAYVVDAGGRLAPAGVAGELYLGGGKLARGYLGRPELTAQRFVPDPYGRLSGGRLYRTGDRVRFRGDGELEFLGRLDGQVKVRGFRIELGEIEAVLGEHERVREAVVTVREDEPGDRRLVGYLVAEGEAPGVEELRTHLRRRLPEPMVPTAWVVLAALPRTPNGKVDRKALPAPAGTRAGSQADYLAPRTPTEQRLAELWAGLLRIERVGVHDNFFDLGGHSLLATQAVSQIRQSFGVELPLRQLFEHPTLAELASALDLPPTAPRPSTIERVSRQAFLTSRSADRKVQLPDSLRRGSR
jgi:amino acid adenylation domain-containing protein